MSDINVDDFFQDAAKALVNLYAVFPRRKAVFVEDIYGAEEPDEFGMRSDRYLACFSALLWLGEEGFLRFEETISQEALDQAVLTARCFTLLSSPPAEPDAEIRESALPASVEAERATHIFRLREALRARSSVAIRQAMLSLLMRMQDMP